MTKQQIIILVVLACAVLCVLCGGGYVVISSERAYEQAIALPTSTPSPTPLPSPTETAVPTDTPQSEPPTPTAVPSPGPSPTPIQPRTPTPALALTPSPLPTNERAFMDCLACAQQPGWLISFQSEPGPGAGTTTDGLRHGDEVTIIEAERHGEEWWYFVEGTYIYGGSDTTVSGWVPETVVTVETPQPYPPGNAWVECAVLAEQGWGDVPVWELPGPSISMAVGKIWHGTQIEVLTSQWDAEHGIWFYEVTGTDYETGETVTGWMDGAFLVLTPP